MKFNLTPVQPVQPQSIETKFGLGDLVMYKSGDVTYIAQIDAFYFKQSGGIWYNIKGVGFVEELKLLKIDVKQI